MRGFNNIVNQALTRNPIMRIDINLFDVSYSICKIVTKAKIGTGFLIKLFKGGQILFSLLTNEHIIQKEMVDKNEKIIIYNLKNNYVNINLNKSERFIECYKNLNITVIEIIKKDKIDENYFLIPNLKAKEFMNKEIYLIEFSREQLRNSEGRIKNIINDFEIIFTTDENYDFAGSPIFLKNSKEVIGIYKAGNTYQENYGILIRYLIQSLNKKSLIRMIDTNLIDVCPSICKILSKTKCGTGFLIKLFKGGKVLLSLLTNEHVIQKEMVDKNENITIYYNLEKNNININLNKSERFIECYKYLDITIIEIIPQDKIEENKFLEPNLETNEFINKEIYIPQFAGGELCNSEGIIKNINNGFEIVHTVGTEYGSSGSPIFLKNSKKVVGIHKAGNFHLTENYGTLISYLIQSLSNNNLIKKSFNVSEKKIYKLIYPNGEIYYGEILNGLKNGKGTEYYKNGKIKYAGDWVNGKFEGYGDYYYEEGEFYKGQWKNNLRHGKGIHYYKNGYIKYNGNFVNGKPEGYGTYIYENGDYYVGQIINGSKNGRGIEYYKNGKIKYDGDWVDDKLEGNGTFNYEIGEYYKGQWINNLRNGKGVQYYKNGNTKYDGEFVNDKYEGQGKYIYEDGVFYIGQWMNNLRHGKGIEFYKNGNIKYEGDWVNGKLEGHGKYIYEDGVFYIGQWMNNLRHGKGTMYYKNGDILLKGTWVNDKSLRYKNN